MLKLYFYFKVLGSKGMVTTGNKRPMEYTKWSLEGNLTNPIYIQGIERYMDSYRLELEHFLDVLQGVISSEYILFK